MKNLTPKQAYEKYLSLYTYNGTMFSKDLEKALDWATNIDAGSMLIAKLIKDIKISKNKEKRECAHFS